MWMTVRSSALKGQMKRYEKELLERLREVMPWGVKVTVVADRGFGDCKLFKALTQELGFEYVIRIRGDIYVRSAKGERRKAVQWVGGRRPVSDVAWCAGHRRAWMGGGHGGVRA